MKSKRSKSRKRDSKDSSLESKNRIITKKYSINSVSGLKKKRNLQASTLDNSKISGKDSISILKMANRHTLIMRLPR